MPGAAQAGRHDDRAPAGFAPLAVITRGGPDRAETWHHGAVAVVSGDGRLVHSVGDPRKAFPLRSCAKPFQLLPFMLDGLGADLDSADIALMMSSHSGESVHTRRVAALLERFAIDPDLLQCGAHLPYDEGARADVLRAGARASVLHSNCSGKHTAMLAVCRHRGWPVESYIDADHPLQRRVATLLGAAGGCRDALDHSIDGCSLPTWWLPLEVLARLFALLASPRNIPEMPEPGVPDALARLYEAGTAHPELVAGSGRLDTRLMSALGTRCLSKGGAAGLQAIAVAPCPRHPAGLGVAIKVADGDSEGRVRAVVAAALLEALGIGDGVEREAIGRPDVLNVRGMVVGRCEPVFSLRSPGVQ